MKKLSEKKRWERINQYIVASARIKARIPRVKLLTQLRLILALGDVLYEEAERLMESGL